MMYRAFYFQLGPHSYFLAARRALSKFEMSIMRSIQAGFTKFTREAYEQILEVLKENAERKETGK